MDFLLYYLKKCESQELGSVDDAGKPRRGQYLLTSKNENVLSLFPPLSTTQYNDSALLPIVPLCSGNKVYCTYVYHNDKFHYSTAKNPRDEYRIYLNLALKREMGHFHKGDIVVIRKEIMEEDDGEQQTVYFMDVLRDRQHPDYILCDDTIANYPIRGGYGVFHGEIPSFEAQTNQVHAVTDASVLIDPSVKRFIEGALVHRVANLFTAASFRDFVMAGYDNRCAITGEVIQYEGYTNLEAAHIRPKSHERPYIPSNGIALGRDLHWAFDKGFFTLNDNLEIVVHPKISSPPLKSLEGKRIRVPSDAFFAPDLHQVHYHNKHVFGLFLTSGK